MSLKIIKCIRKVVIIMAKKDKIKEDKNKWFVLTLLAIAQFMVVLDVSVVNIALPHIQSALRFSPENLQWIVTAYTLAVGGFLLLGGRVADLYGRKRTFLIGTALFGIASLITGFSNSETTMILARALQGLTAAFMSPAALSIVITMFKEGKERNKALGVWAAVAAGGAAAGVLLGGIITEYASWRWNFFINVPVALGVVYLGLKHIPESTTDLGHRHIDLRGATLVTSGLMLLVYGLTEAPSKGWTSDNSIITLGLSAILLIGFIVNEIKVKHPLMPLQLFKIRNVLGANLTQFPITASLFSMFFFLSLYIQTILQYSPVKSGLSFLPVTIIIGIVSGIVSSLIARTGYKKILVIAPLVMALGLFILAKGTPVGGTYLGDVFPGLAVMAVGLGMSFVSLTIAATSGVPKHESGLASGVLNTSQQIGGALGLAILSGVSASKTADVLEKAQGQITPLVQADALVQGFHSAFYVGAGFAVAASIFALFLVKDLSNTGKPLDQ